MVGTATAATATAADANPAPTSARRRPAACRARAINASGSKFSAGSSDTAACNPSRKSSSLTTRPSP